MKYQPYRDEPYQRECADRYEPIKKLCEQFNRPFSVLDVGANFGWFGHQLVKDFENCVYVGLDNKTIDPHPRIYHINKHLDAQTMAAWSRSDHFDVVLGLSVLHHFKDYGVAFNALRRLGTWLIVEIPGENDEGTLAPESHQGLLDIFKGVEPLATFPSHKSGVDRPMYVTRSEAFISEQSLDAPLRGAQGYATYKIWQDFDHCVIEIDRLPRSFIKEVRDYIPGINLHNFNMLNGTILEVPETEGHPDDKPWNYVLSKDGPVPIDSEHKK